MQLKQLLESGVETPFFYYDINLLDSTLSTLKSEADKYDFHVHYAMKANVNIPILKQVKSHGLGADCVSGNEIARALEAGFRPDEIVFAGVGKTDREINFALDKNIFCFNVESLQELEVINELASKAGKVAPVAVRLNPDIDAQTHEYITTGKGSNKFGIGIEVFLKNLDQILAFKHLNLLGMHFHVGSQVLELSVFNDLCTVLNDLQNTLEARGVIFKHLNVGGGLGINYEDPEKDPVPNFAKYFALFNQCLERKEGQEIHFELGRSIVGQCGKLLTKVLYTKVGVSADFAVVDAGMTELMRPALYQAYHHMKAIGKTKDIKKYHVVGPICESSDFLGKNVDLPTVERGDIIQVDSVGAYGQVMSSQYNLRDLAKAYYSS